MTIREPAAFPYYTDSTAELREMLRAFFSKTKRERISSAVISPHAGYPYSGRIAAKSISKLVEARTFVILGTNHTGLGARLSVSSHDSWETPLGTVGVDSALSKTIVENSSAEFDELAHLGEHSVELQIPFLQHQFKDLKIVAVSIMTDNIGELLELGNALARHGEDIAVIASGDFSHHIPLKAAEEKDLGAIKLIEEMKAEEFHALVQEKNLSICGCAPITALIEYCRKKGMKKGKLLEYTTSAEVMGDTSSVVGYASIIFY